MIAILFWAAGLAVGGVSSAEGVAPRVALIHGSFDNYRHRDDYDAVMKELGWKLDKVENKDFGKLMERLGDCDLVLGTALYNYSNVQDFSAYRDQLFAFMDRGGAVVFTDTNYAPHVDWLAKWGEDWSVRVAPCQTTSTAMKWLDTTHPIFSSLTPIRQLSATWVHMVPGAGWQVISRCEDDGATGLFRLHGRGFMLLTSYWPCSAAMLQNLWTALQCTRAGLTIALPDLTAFTLGDNVAKATVRNTTDQAIKASMVIEVKEPSGAPKTYQAEMQAQPKQETTGQVTVPFRERGAYELTARLVSEGKAILESRPVKVDIPELLVVRLTEPKYRGTVMAAAPPKEVKAQVTVHPFKEEVAQLQYAARLVCAGRTIVALPARTLPGLELEVSFPFAAVEPGPVALEVDLLQRGQKKPLASVKQEIKLLAVRKAQVFIDEDLNTRVEGEPFFPIAVYHIPAKDFPRAKELGFNSIQAWGTTLPQAKENLDAAQAQGLKVILEGATYAANSGDLAALDPAVQACESHPALLAWYLTDEPSGEERLVWCRRVYHYLAEKDPNHPVFMTSCSPGEFERYSGVTDIFAVDPYPIPNSVVMVSDWMKRAQAAVGGRKPVWLIPQLHNWAAYSGHPENGRGPTPQEERNMVYQGLVWGAKAIFYYPWDDGPTGLTHDASLMEAVRGINGELAALGPELLTRKHEVTAQNEPPHEGLFASIYRGGGRTYLIAVNVLKETKTLPVPAPGVNDGDVEVLFESRRAQVKNGAISDEFQPLAVHVYRER